MPIATASALIADETRRRYRSSAGGGSWLLSCVASGAAASTCTNELIWRIILYMRTIDLESLRIFRTVVDEGGVVRAATKLNRVQSNVTTRIRQLEEHVGARLFRREGRNVRLSAEGQKLLGYADRLLRLADEAVSEMRTGKPRGVFRLGSLESTAGAAFRRFCPAITRCSPRSS